MAGLQVGTVGGGPTVRVARPGLGTGAASLGGGDLSALPAIESKLRADENSLQIQAMVVTRFSRFASNAFPIDRNECLFAKIAMFARCERPRFRTATKQGLSRG
jgi:hypothetical protein